MSRKDPKKKKNAQLVLRLNKELRDRFVEACQDLDTSAAREVRRFIKRFLKRYENGEFDEYLFNLVKDRDETTNLIDDHADRVKAMTDSLEEWQTSVIRSLNGEDY